MPLFIFLLSLLSSIFIFTPAYATEPFSLKSSAFENNAIIPVTYSCDGKNISPELSWTKTPAKTESLVLICKDPDAPSGTWYHWIVYNLPATLSKLPEATALPTGAAFGKNSEGKAQYSGPCPPASSLHHYIFTLYALDIKLPLDNGAEHNAVENAMQGHIIGETSLTGVLRR